MILYTETGEKLLDLIPDDSSYHYSEVMGDDKILLYFALAEYVIIPIGAWVESTGGRYTMLSPPSVDIINRREYKYSIEMHAEASKLASYKFREMVYSSETDTFGGSMRLSFSLTAKPSEHLAMIVANMNQREVGGWSIGDCIDKSEVCVTYSNISILDALKQLASECETEYEIIGHTISLHKVEYNKTRPLPLSYGKGNGLKKGVKRTNDKNAFGVLFVTGGERNIDKSKYGSQSLLLPKYQEIGFDGEHFSDEGRYSVENARVYRVDEYGYGISRVSPSQSSRNEDSLDLSDIYPYKDHFVTRVVEVNKDKHLYDITIDAPEELDYRKYQIDGENPTVVFQDGMLAGKEFDLETNDSGVLKISKFTDVNGRFLGWNLQLVAQETDGMTMPGGVFVPRVNETVRIFGIQLPQEYICDNGNRSGAEWQMFREAVRYMYENEEHHFTIKAELDGIWSKEHWGEVSSYLRCGSFVAFSDPSVQSVPLIIRITGIKDYLNNPYAPEITLNTSVSSGSVGQALREIDNTRYDAGAMYKESVSFTKRRFREADETMRMLEGAMLNGFDSSINPVAVQAMQLLVGSESLQFDFIRSRTNPVKTDISYSWNSETKRFFISLAFLRHYTVGMPKTLITTGDQPKDYPVWTVNSAFFDIPEDDGEMAFYLYARCRKNDYFSGSAFFLSPEAIDMDGVDEYFFLVGILNSEFEGQRSFARMYGFTEILPGRVVADNIVANDLLLAERAKIKNLYTDDLEMLDADNNVLCKISGGVIECNTGVFKNVEVEGDVQLRKLKYRGTAVDSNGVIVSTFVDIARYIPGLWTERFFLPRLSLMDSMEITLFAPIATRMGGKFEIGCEDPNATIDIGNLGLPWITRDKILDFAQVGYEGIYKFIGIGEKKIWYVMKYQR